MMASAWRGVLRGAFSTFGRRSGGAAVIAAALLVAGPGAKAADIARPLAAPPAVVPAPVFSWTGFYIGGHAGYGWSSGSDGVGAIDTSGVLGGGQAGYNYQFANNLVVGLEADLSAADLSGRLGGVSTSVDTLGSVRGRLGYAAGRFMPYVTGGFAFGNQTVDVLGIDQSKTLTGWTAGAGLEYALTDHWTARSEYLYTDLGSKFYDALGAQAGATSQTVRAGINFKF